MSRLKLKTDLEYQREEIEKQLYKNKNKYGKFLVEISADVVHKYDQKSNISKISRFSTHTGELNSTCKMEYYLEGKTITCIRTTEKYKGMGQATCHADDEFDLKTGIRIAESRAKIDIEKQKIKKLSNND